MDRIIGNKHLERCPPGERLVRSAGVVLVFPQPQAVLALFGVGEPFAMKQLLVVRTVAPLNDAVLPRAVRGAARMDKFQGLGHPLERGFALRVGGEAHGEFVGVVGPDQKRGGSRSIARRKTPATVREE